MHRVRIILQDKDYRRYLDLNAKAEQQRIYCKHDYYHAVYVARLTYLLAMDKDFEKAVSLKPLIYAAGVLHDIGRWVEYDTGEDHALVSARLAGPILQQAGFSSEEIKSIVIAVSEHRRSDASGLGALLAEADDLSRECHRCAAVETCYKSERMLELQNCLEV